MVSFLSNYHEMRKRLESRGVKRVLLFGVQCDVRKGSSRGPHEALGKDIYQPKGP